MKKFNLIAVALLGMLVLGACSTSNEVVGGGIFQKRKYTGGVYWDRTEKIKSSNEKTEEEFDIFRINEDSQKKYVSSTTIYNEDRMVASSDDAILDVSSKDKELIELSSDAKSEGSTSAASTVSTEKSSSTDAKTDQKKSKILVKKKSAPAPGGDVNTVLLVILAILIPPLAVFLFEGASTRFWIDLILALIGWGIGFWLLGGLGWICGILAIIYALLIVLGVI
jgi:uncharacterized membrane protein YqaE (UPF0057 family)